MPRQQDAATLLRQEVKDAAALLRQDTEKSTNALQSEITSLVTILRGNGDPSKGIIVRLDRIEQWQQGIISLAGKALFPIYAYLVLQILALFVLFVTGQIHIVWK